MTAKRLDDHQVGQRLAEILETEANSVEVSDAWDAIASRLLTPDSSTAHLEPVGGTRRRRLMLGGVAAGIAVAAAIVMAVVLGWRPALAPAPVSPATSAPSQDASMSTSPSPSSTFKPATPTNIITTRDIDEVTPNLPGCDFDVTGRFKAQETAFSKDDLTVLMIADEESVLTNPANDKTFNATGDSVVVGHITADGEETVMSEGPTLHPGPLTLPGQTKRQEGLIFTIGRVTFQRHNIGTDKEWREITKIGGPRTDVCKALSD